MGLVTWYIWMASRWALSELFLDVASSWTISWTPLHPAPRNCIPWQYMQDGTHCGDPLHLAIGHITPSSTSLLALAFFRLGLAVYDPEKMRPLWFP
ncbi:hypothetical protein JAAARDRAFT_28893 [Jaapia argillacea MUCL 33604]|uniref:Uncharacterized protein n=1 Tax=Jaapia argillacea MUCL 33604 TaxID=933084 RepID=A0A067Q7K4_9AGAM|nr:hypothetical protein JAAARDRAFT_28893 [Jaapia argillacea MUCL 33604]